MGFVSVIRVYLTGFRHEHKSVALEPVENGPNWPKNNGGNMQKSRGIAKNM